MSYELRGFATGQTLLADDLNHMESGIAAACTQAEETAAALEAVKSRVGLSAGVKNALLECFSRVAWTDEGGLSAYVKLQNAMDAMGEPSGDAGGGSGDSGGDTTLYRVTYQLLNCDVDNRVAIVSGGKSYVATVTPNEGYEFHSASVTVDGVTTEVTDGLILVNNVQSDIVVTAVATISDVTIGVEEFTDNVSLNWNGWYPYWVSQDGTGKKTMVPSEQHTYLVASGASYTVTLTYTDDSLRTYKWAIGQWEKALVDAKADCTRSDTYRDSGWKTTRSVTISPDSAYPLYYIGFQVLTNSASLQSIRIKKGV